MKYQNMLWAGFREAADFATRRKLGTEGRVELAAFLQSEYNAGANDVIEYLRGNPDEVNSLFTIFDKSLV